MSFYYSLNKNRDRDALDSATFTNQAPGPGVFEGESVTDIITTPVDAITAGLPAAVGAASSLSLAGASGISKQAFDYFGMDTMSGAASKAENFWLSQTDEAVTAIKSLRPNPKTQGAALQLFSGVAEVLPRAVFLGPIGAGLVSGIENTTENVQEGKDIATAAKLGATTGLVEGIGIGLPASLGVSLAGKVASGAAMNVGLGMVERKSKSQILSDAGYHAQAEQYKWNDNTSMLIDGVLGSAFGALPGGGKDTRPAAEQMFGGLGEVITPSLLDKALLANDARRIDELAPGIPTTVEASNAHVKAMDESINALEQGDEVSANVVDFTGQYYHPDIEKQIADFVVENDTTIEDFAQSYPDVYNGIIESQYRNELEIMSESAGWSQKGGELLRDIEGNAVGRTTWLPKQEWFGDFVKEGLGNKNDLQKAVTKYLNDETLGPKQTRIIELLRDQTDGKNQDGQSGSFSTIDRKAELNNAIQDQMYAMQERLAIQRESSAMPFDDSIPGFNEKIKIGSGSTGEVYRVGNEVIKKSTNIEADVYNELSGIDGIAQGYEINGEIRTPFYKNIISVDDIEFDKRKNLSNIVAKNEERINNTISEITNKGFYYNDPLQFGLAEGNKMDLLDFSMAEKNTSDTLINDNLGLLSTFYRSFGAEKQAKAVDKVADVYGFQVLDAIEKGQSLVSGKFEGVDYDNLTASLNGKPAKFAYYTTNARHVQIKGIAQTDVVDGIKVVLSENRIDKSKQKEYELINIIGGVEKDAKAKPQLKNNSDIPEVQAAKEMLVNHGDSIIPWENDMGEVEHINASELLTRMDDERMFTDNAESATQAAINCFLSFGDKL